jgi:hypothetical protein
VQHFLEFEVLLGDFADGRIDLDGGFNSGELGAAFTVAAARFFNLEEAVDG